MRRPCIQCGAPADNTRCPTCTDNLPARHRPYRPRPHYAGDYRRRAAFIRATTRQCWICGGGPTPGDPWTADHLQPGNPDSPLAGAHRSCNSSRGNAQGTRGRRGQGRAGIPQPTRQHTPPPSTQHDKPDANQNTHDDG